MSVLGYLGPNVPDVEIPQRCESEVVRVVSELVTSGFDDPKRRLLDESAKALEDVRLEGARLPGGLVRRGFPEGEYASVEDYDPVLGWHCRL